MPNTDSDQSTEPVSPIEVDGPGHIIIIDLTPDTTSVTSATTVTWQMSLKNYSGPSQPTPSLSFYEVVPSSTANVYVFRDIVVSPTPTVSWDGTVGSFSVYMDSAIFNQFEQNPTSFAVKAEIPNVQSSGLSKIDVDLPPA